MSTRSFYVCTQVLMEVAFRYLESYAPRETTFNDLLIFC
jgi:hypothetical protein